jgi:ATP/maltotriose-dependent transcriptional regulator MalT/DNA-binding SARP family transcriptional activator
MRPPAALFPAKVTPPKAADAMPRPRLIAQLDGVSERRLTWVTAPAGSGKTTLVADYLRSCGIAALWYNCDEGDADPASFFYYMREAARRVIGQDADSLPLLRPEYVTDVETFSRLFFEGLSQQLVTRASGAVQAILVFDNFQDVPLSDAVQAILAGGPEGLCEGVRAIVISRAEPPAVLARAQAGGQVAQLDFNDLRFTEEETRALVGMRHPQVRSEALLRVYELTQGWVAGITLILAGHSHEELAARAPFEDGFESLMNYFAEEIFGQLNAEYRRFLLETALLPTVNPELANRLTETEAAAQILGELCRGHLFTKRLDGEGNQYQYHPLWREFLRAKAKTLYSAAQWNAVRTRAARLLEEAHQVDDAARLFAEAGDSEGLAHMVKEHAQDLLAQGRNQTLEGWLTTIAGAAANDPWIRYWRGMCWFPMDLARSREALQAAMASFQAAGNRQGEYLAWAGLVDTYSFGMDDWRPLEHCLAIFDKLQAADPEFPDRATELMVISRLLAALTAVRMDDPSLVEHWIERMNVLLELPAPADIRNETVFVVSVYYLWRGAYEKNAVLLERAEAELRMRRTAPFTAIRIKIMEAVHCWISTRYGAAYQAVDEGFAIAAESGIHVFDSLLWSFKAAAHLAQGELEQGAEAVAQQLAALLGQERTLDVYFYHINAAWHALLVDNPALAEEHLQSVARKVERIGNLYYLALWHLGMAQTELLLDRPAKAMEHAQIARGLGQRMDSSVVQWYALGVEAWILLKQGKRAEGLQALRGSLAIGRRHGYIHLELYLPQVMRFLLTRALEAEIEPEYVRGMIRAVKLMPPLANEDHGLSLAVLAHWPFRVRVYAMGRFEIRIQDEPLSFTGKEKKKLLEMLKVLIALGAVDVDEDLLSDELWPEAEGDLAHKSLETTLSRLRKLLGSESSILYRSRRLTLNPAECWVDCLALEQMLARLKTLPSSQAAALADQAIALYQGRFLGGDHTAECFASYQEHLREELESVLLRLGRSAESAGDWGRAADHYQQAIAIDPLGEECYLRLMVCQRQQGNHTAAVRTYLRCEQNLRAGLEMDPSPETQALYRLLTQTRRDRAAGGGGIAVS